MENARKITIGLAIGALVIGAGQAIFMRSWEPLPILLPVAFIVLANWPRKD